MLTFFHGWRRKLGCGALLVALIVTAAWARTWTTTDSIDWRTEPQSLVRMTSCDGRIQWVRRHLSPHAPVGWGWTDSFGFATEPATADDVDFFLLESAIIKTRWEWCGLCVGEVVAIDRPDARFEISFWYVPYWLIVLPLTLLSAYLLLVKPRVAKNLVPAKPPEST